jgi:hypothetical protein
MKLLVCFKCNDIVALLREARACRCGAVTGKYLADDIHAEFTGDGCLIGFANNSFGKAIERYKRSHITSTKSVEFVAFVIPPACGTVKKLG